MLYRADSYYDHQSAKDVDVPKAFPLRCAVADIATVVKGARWGAWIFNSRLERDPVCARWASNGWTIEHKIEGGMSSPRAARCTRISLAYPSALPRTCSRDSAEVQSDPTSSRPAVSYLVRYCVVVKGGVCCAFL